jgi:hypothetical protein
MAGTFGHPDSDAASMDGEPLPQRTGLQFVRQLRAEKKAEKVEQVTLHDNKRPEFELVCTVPKNMEEIFGINTKAEEHAQQEGNPSQAVISACMTLAFYTVSLKCRGAEVSAGGGSPFADPALHEELGVNGMTGASWRAVRELYVAEGDVYDDNAVIRLVNVLMERTGATSRSVVVNPT